MTGVNGSLRHSSSGPVGTTSVWPAKQSTGWASPRRAQRLVTLPNCRVSIEKPLAANRSVIKA